MGHYAYVGDDPETVSGINSKLGTAASDMDGSQQRLIGHASGITSAWPDEGGQRASSEVDKLADLSHMVSVAMTTAKSALNTYRGKLVTERGTVDTLNSQYNTAVTTRDNLINTAYYPGKPTDVSESQVSTANSDFNTEKSRLDGLYGELETRVKTAATTAKNGLSEVNGVFGDTSGGIPAAVGKYMDGQLPILHDQNMIDYAKDAAKLTELGTMDPDALKKLAEKYGIYADDPMFAKTFLEEMGPDGLLWFTANLSKWSGDTTPEDLQDLAGGLQGMMGIILAAGTNMDSTTHVSQDWVNQLKKEGREKIDFGSYSYQPYGYQVLGVLMHRGAYSDGFLKDIGNDMYDFEKETKGGIWTANQPAGAMYSGYQLDMINDGNAGFDPMIGFMSALDRNASAAKEFFGQGDPSADNSLVDYFLTQRQWPKDSIPGGPPYTDGHDEPLSGTDLMGGALKGATTVDPDQKGADIMEGVVHSIATQDRPDDKHFKDFDYIPDDMRDSVGDMVRFYIGDVNAAYQAGLIPEGDPGAWDNPALPGKEGFHALFNSHDLTVVLGDAAKDEDAYTTIHDGQVAYTAAALKADATTPGLSVLEKRESIDSTANTAGNIFGALEYGHGTGIATEAQDLDDAANSKVDTYGKVGSFVFGELAGKIPGPVGTVVNEGGSAYIDALVQGSQQDTSGKAAYDIGQSYGHGRDVVQGLVYDSINRYDLFTDGQQPPASILDSDGHVDPDKDATAYSNWAARQGKGAYAPIGDADESFTTGVSAAERELG